MRYIRKYNESVDLNQMIIDEINSLFSDSEWGSLSSTSGGHGEPWVYTFTSYAENHRLVFDNLNNNSNIGFRLNMPSDHLWKNEVLIHADDALKSIEVIQEFLIKMKRLVKNIQMSLPPNNIISNVSFLEYDLVCINIYKKSETITLNKK